MMPIIRIGSVDISTYWLMMFVGCMSMAWLMLKRKKRFGISIVQALGFALCLMICGLLGTKILYVLEHLDEVKENGMSLGGLSFYGAVFLVPILMPLLTKVLPMNRSQINDASSLCGLSMLGSIRFGCFLNGCCGGIQAELMGLSFRWPTQAIESIGDFLILSVLYSAETQDRGKGKMYPLFMLSYSILRFLVEIFRDTPKDLLFLSRGQWYALVSIFVAVIWVRKVSNPNE